MPSLSKADVRDVIDVIKGLYLSDMIPWICGYSGGKDSTAVVQLVWEALSEIPANQRKKAVYVISTDTLVESPVVALWAKQSIEKMKARAQEDNLPIFPHRLTPTVNNSFWVNLIGRGYPYPRNDFRWCTDRLKIEPSNRFIKGILDSESEAILVLGTRKAESVTRKAVMEGYEKRRYRDHLSPNGSFPNSYVFTPIENWSNDNVWQFLLQYHNPWGQSNKNLMSMYSGASADGECPLVID
ncbi:MAG: DNA phosphorothioation system sulfurtransferase DndC, partial [Clostridia bacterium]|nr:DNA phosphorothioation system sulfurtransferase DndC [Clostridia bacterium]